MRLTDRSILAALARPASRDRLISDGSNGLALRIRAKSGTAAFVVLYRHRGRPRRVSLGVYPSVSLKAAREQAMTMRQQILAGADPVTQRHEARAAQRDALTVSDLLDEYLNVHVRVKCSPVTVKEWTRIVDRDIRPAIGKTAAPDLTHRMVILMLDRVRQRGALSMTNRVYDTFRAAWKFAMARGLIDFDPTARITRRAAGGEERSRDRILSVDEIRLFWTMADQVPCADRILAGLRLLLLTGVRIGELMRSKVVDIDLDRAAWHIPAETSKSGRDRTLPLSTQAVALFKAMIEESQLLLRLTDEDDEDSPLAPSQYAIASFSTKADHPVSRTAFINAYREILRIAKIEGVWIHDLRRTMRSGLGTLGVPAEIAERCIGHALPSLLRTYDRSDHLQEQRAAMQKWANCIDRIAADEVASVTAIAA